MKYEDAIKYINEVSKIGSILGLETEMELLKRLNNPQNSLNVIHIAGTNGKGSILAYLEEIFENGGYKVGRYISPTIFTYLERFQINKNYINENIFAKYLETVKEKVDEMVKDGLNHPTAFEIETAVSFLYFKESKVDIVLLETGMGGRLDGTNVVERPICTVFASISMDHMGFLGDTIEKITEEKAGIMRKGVPAISYPSNVKTMKILKNRAKMNNSQFIAADEEQLQVIEDSINGRHIFKYKKETYEINLLGYYQMLNCITAIETVEAVKESFYVAPEIIKKALKNTKWQGRMEVLSYNPLFIRDGAHNDDAALQLKNTIIKYFSNKRLIFIIGVLGDKEYDKILAHTAPLASHIFTITPNNLRGLPSEKLSENAKKYCNNVVSCNDVEAAIIEAYKVANETDIIIAFGSLSYIGEIDKYKLSK